MGPTVNRASRERERKGKPAAWEWKHVDAVQGKKAKSLTKSSEVRFRVKYLNEKKHGKDKGTVYRNLQYTLGNADSNIHHWKTICIFKKI